MVCSCYILVGVKSCRGCVSRGCWYVVVTSLWWLSLVGVVSVGVVGL